jgi:hypothetical protein
MHQTNFKSDAPTRVDRRISQDREDAANLRRVYRLVDHRDGRTCRACGKRTNPDEIGLKRGHRHHIEYRSQCGRDCVENLITLCASCHDAEHIKRTLEIVCIEPQLGAEGICEFWRKDGNGLWYLSKRELSVGRFEKD